MGAPYRDARKCRLRWDASFGLGAKGHPAFPEQVIEGLKKARGRRWRVRQRDVEAIGSQLGEQVRHFTLAAGGLDGLRQVEDRFIVTNQSGVGKGELTLDEANRVNGHVVERLRAHGVHIAAVYCCPHRHTDNCACIKPKPHFLLHAARCHGLDLRRSFVIGDHPHDVEFARNAGTTGLYVLTSHGLKHRAELRSSEIVAADIGTAADWILARTCAVTMAVPDPRSYA